MRICILAAGKGSRMGVFADAAHKALLPLNNKAIISRIIEQFSHGDEFVIAVGFKKDQIKDYLTLAYPQKKFTFVDVDNYDGPGSGPGYSLFCCRQHLQESFVFSACDTLIVSSLPGFQDNWMGVKKVDHIAQWCSVKADAHKKVTGIFYKEPVDSNLAFVGLAFVKDFASFWKGLEKNRSLQAGELQVNNGLEGLIPHTLKAVPLEWQDAGNEENYTQLLRVYSSNFSFDGKTTDITYQHDDQVIKFFADANNSRLRYQRAAQYRDVFAAVQQWQGNFYSYTFEKGTLLSKLMNAQECSKFLEWSENKLWKEISVKDQDFKKVCYDFYYQKTLKRLKNFCDQYLPNGEQEDCLINSLHCQTVESLLNQIDQRFYEEGLSSTYHGDLHDDNVIVNDSRYILIDWRESFGTSLAAGDRYYDLAKFVHTLTFSVEAMKNKAYDYIKNGHAINIKHAVSSNSQAAIQAFLDFLNKYSYNLKRVRIIEALIFINMSPLYNKDLGTYLYYLGRYSLQKELNTT